MSVVAITKTVKPLKTIAITKSPLREAHGKQIASQRAAGNAKRSEELGSLLAMDPGHAFADTLPAVARLQLGLRHSLVDLLARTGHDRSRIL